MATPNNAEKPQEDPNAAFGPPDEEEVPEAAPAPAPKAKAPATPEKPVVSPSLRRLAKQVGIEDEDIDLSSPEQIQDAIFFIQERDRLHAANAKNVATKPVEEDDDPELTELDASLALDPKFKNYLKSKSSKSAKEIKALKDALAAQEKREQDRLTVAGIDAFDEGLESLGEEYKSIVGEGGYAAMKKDSEEYAARAAIFKLAGIDFATDSPATIKRKGAKAAKILFGKFAAKKAASAPVEPEEEDEAPYQPKKKAPPSLTKRAPREGPDLSETNGNVDPEWEDAGTARPTNRKVAKKKDPREVIRQYYDEKGVPGETENGVFDGIPE